MAKFPSGTVAALSIYNKGWRGTADLKRPQLTAHSAQENDMLKVEENDRRLKMSYEALEEVKCHYRDGETKYCYSYTWFKLEPEIQYRRCRNLTRKTLAHRSRERSEIILK